MNNSDNCSCLETPWVTVTNYWISDILLPIFCTAGIFGNLLAVFILKHPETETKFHQSLLTLAICHILLMIVILTEHFADLIGKLYVLMFPYFCYPLKNI